MSNQKELTGLENCSLYAHLLMLEKACSMAGYGYVEIMDRRLPKQKSRYGGYEMVLHGMVGRSKLKVIVKVVRDTLHVRNFAELNGAIQQSGADFGILVSPHIPTDSFIANLPKFHERIDLWAGKTYIQVLKYFKIGFRLSGEPDYAQLQEYERLAEKSEKALRKFKADAKRSRP